MSRPSAPTARCGNCGLTLNSSGCCSLCDRPRRVLVAPWWVALDIDWVAEQRRLDALDATLVIVGAP